MIAQHSLIRILKTIISLQMLVTLPYFAPGILLYKLNVLHITSKVAHTIKIGMEPRFFIKICNTHTISNTNMEMQMLKYFPMNSLLKQLLINQLHFCINMTSIGFSSDSSSDSVQLRLGLRPW